MTQGLHFFLVKLTAQFSVSIQRVPARVGLTGNERADRLAKISSQALQTQNTVTYRESQTLLQSWFNGDWKKENGGYHITRHTLTQFRDRSRPSRPVSSTCVQHCGLSAHLVRTGISDTSLCECGQADQTPDHVLQSCPKYAQRTSANMAPCADLVTKLWCLVEDLYQMAGFVVSIRLKIWPAQL